jgi:pimeloyl-ACP methyl ester carboxylesterase
MFEPLEGSVRSADGTRIAYERSGTGPALIMVDPAGRYRELGSYRSLARLLAPHFTVFVYDRRGRGASSDRQPYAPEREIDDLAALIEAAGGSAFVYAVTSGALLALHAASAGLPIPALAVFEPPIWTDDRPGEKRDLTGELAGLIARGERAEAVELFHTAIGVPAELVAGMREAESWPALVEIAHTFVYDCRVSDATTLDVIASVGAPTLVIDSERGTGGLTTGWARAVAGALPDATRSSLVGQWHIVPDEDVAEVLTEYFQKFPG